MFKHQIVTLNVTNNRYIWRITGWWNRINFVIDNAKCDTATIPNKRTVPRISDTASVLFDSIHKYQTNSMYVIFDTYHFLDRFSK